MKVGGGMLNDNCWYQIEDGPKFKYRKLENIVKICTNKSAFTFFVTLRSPFVLISIISDEIWFFKVQVKRVSSK
jgi:hypothetical protein